MEDTYCLLVWMSLGPIFLIVIGLIGLVDRGTVLSESQAAA
jgi:hypothetical protein